MSDDLAALEEEVRRLLRLVPATAAEDFRRTEDGFISEHTITGECITMAISPLWMPSAAQYLSLKSRVRQPRRRRA
jgi:hypothetical protein